MYLKHLIAASILTLLKTRIVISTHTPCQLVPRTRSVLTENCTGNITINICRGACLSYQVFDMEPPFHVRSYHPTCMVTSYEKIYAMLTDCEGDHEPEVYTGHTITECACDKCDLHKEAICMS